MKINQRLDYTRLTEALGELGLVSPEALQAALEQSMTTGALLPGLLVDDGLVADWELSRVSSEVFNLPFLTVDVYAPSEEAMQDLDPEFLRRFALVPLDRYEKLLTVAMPAMVPTDVLTNLARRADAHVIAVVGSVASNRRWLEDHLPEPDPSATPDQVAGALPNLDNVAAALPDVQVADGAKVVDDDWGGMFDAADAAVQLDILGADLEEESGL